ncbi:MAG: hypothetical protein H0U73_01025 [Tatlockia sp.]|nr:hypothetical protein [Tatlockia sp.]
MYLLQYAFIYQDHDLFGILNNIVLTLNKKTVTKLIEPAFQRDQLITNITNDIKVKPMNLDAKGKIALVKNLFHKHVNLINVINRLEYGSNSYNPYWIYSEYKLNCIVDSLLECARKKSNIDLQLNDPESMLSKAVNMRRLLSCNFFSTCQPCSPVESRDIINNSAHNLVL